ncbi:MAG TPA: DUF4339 domain-containing protein [Burkholderiaceae bacterium]|nr:DUF4339 domain-containing protein [Burkholderiaceae bacterium]
MHPAGRGILLSAATVALAGVGFALLWPRRAADGLYYLDHRAQPRGPIDRGRLRAMLADGRLAPDAPVSLDGSDDWRAAIHWIGRGRRA